MRVLLIDDHPVFRRGLIYLLTDLAAELSIEFLEADSVDAATPYCDEPVDLILLDLNMPGVSGEDAFAAITQKFEGARVVVVSSENSPGLIRSLIDAGACGFIPKATHPDILVSAIRLAADGAVYIPREALNSLVATDLPKLSDNSILQANALGLTPRQHEVLCEAVNGSSNKVIARRLSLSEGTVKAHLSAAFRVLNVKSRTQAVLRIAQDGYPAVVDE